MSLKRIIPIDIYEDFGNDDLAADLYIRLLINAKSEDMELPNKRMSLKRGQVIFRTREYAKKLRSSVGATHRALVRLQKEYGRVNTEWNSKWNSKTSPGFTIVSILSFDKFIRLEQQVEQQVNIERRVKEPKKSDESKYYGNEILRLFEESVRRANGGVLPTTKSERLRRNAYWNVLQLLGVKNGMKTKQDLPKGTATGINDFVVWLRNEYHDKGYTIQTVDKLKEKVHFYKQNIINP